MIDPFDAALSEFIDTLPADAEFARQLLEENAPFTGRGDLPEFAELATRLRAVPPPQPRPEWVAASKARLMTAPLLPPEKRGFTWLGSMFLPFSHLSFPTLTLPRLTMPSPVFARAAMALVMILTLASVAHQRSGQNPIVPLTTDQAPEQDAQQAIAATQDQVARLGDGQQSQVAGVEVQGTVRDVVLLSQQIDLAELAIDKAPPAQQPQLRSQLQSAVRAVRFDGQLEAITNDGATLQVSGVAVQADPTLASKLQVGQPVSLLVRVNGNGKLQAVQASPASALPSPSPAVAVAPTTRKSVRRRDDDAGNGGAPAGAGSAANGNGQPGAGAAAGGNQPAANGAGATVNGVAATGSDGSSGSCAAGGIPGCGSNGNGGPGTGGATANGAAGNGQLGAVGGNGNSTPGNVQTGSGSQGAVSQAGQVSVGSSSSSSQVSSSVSVTSSGTSHSVSVSVSSSSSSSSQQSSGGSSSKGGGDHAQGGRMLAAARISLASSDNKGKGKADHKG